ncbi:MAG: radical SAM protein, partial [Lachnospiraceae bacterium]|nr:radical SAM protein [Lachnospiraceae bacterium]
ILRARRSSSLDFADLKKMGVVLKRAHYFITCKGKMMHRIRLEENVITTCLVDQNRRQNWQLEHGQETYRQMSLFEDGKVERMPTVEDTLASVLGQL